MFPHLAPRSTFRILVAITLTVSLLSMPVVFSPASEAAQGQGAGMGKPRRDKPEGELPDLEAVQGESLSERETPAPIHSTVRAPKVPLEPWNGRRVGDSEPPPKREKSETVQPDVAQLRRAHARRRFIPPPPVLDDQFIQNFFTWTVLRAPTASESTYWKDQFRVAYAQGQAYQLHSTVLGGALIAQIDQWGGRRGHIYARPSGHDVLALDKLGGSDAEA